MGDLTPRVRGPFSMAKAAATHLIRCDQEAMKITACLNDIGRLPRVMEEVDRRAEVFATVAREVPWRTEHPRLAALKSVARDVAEGSLG